MGVTFTEQAWRDFLEFLNKNGVVNTQPVDITVDTKIEDEAAVDRIVKAYEKHQDTQITSDAIREIFANAGEPLRVKDIYEGLRQKGLEVSLSSMTNRVRTAARVYPEIVKIGHGMYGIKYPDLPVGPERPGDHDAD